MKNKISFWSQLGLGIKSYSDALGLVIQKGLWWSFVYPIVLAVIMFFGSFSLASVLSHKIELWITETIGSENSEGWISMFSGVLHFFIAIAFKIIFFFIYSTFSKYIILILMSPLMAWLSEKSEELLTGKKYSFSLSQFLKDVFRGVMIALRNMLIEFLLIFLCFFIAFIPVIGWLASLLLLILSYYYYGFSMIDYCNERRKRSIMESIHYIRKNKGLAIGNGFLFSILFNLPFIGTIIAPVLAPVAATIAVVELEKE